MHIYVCVCTKQQTLMLCGFKTYAIEKNTAYMQTKAQMQKHTDSKEKSKQHTHSTYAKKQRAHHKNKKHIQYVVNKKRARPIKQHNIQTMKNAYTTRKNNDIITILVNTIRALAIKQNNIQTSTTKRPYHRTTTTKTLHPITETHAQTIKMSKTKTGP